MQRLQAFQLKRYEGLSPTVHKLRGSLPARSKSSAKSPRVRPRFDVASPRGPHPLQLHTKSRGNARNSSSVHPKGLCVQPGFFIYESPDSSSARPGQRSSVICSASSFNYPTQRCVCLHHLQGPNKCRPPSQATGGSAEVQGSFTAGASLSSVTCPS